ncbi:hypothetical protein [Halorubellus sp. PRR65]|uniref:hypothetical protein n=1 Tax=Halorubellus sp. PRR65 TaxID=3098148 RepID=UPI002B25D7ED|nr:hypothetical protein [Halorubellus sp. PRR65]
MSDDDQGYGQTDACPYCDAGPEALYRRGPGFSKSQRTVAPDKDWYCRNCEAAFDTPERRARAHPGGFTAGSLADRLDQADPSAVGGDPR